MCLTNQEAAFLIKFGRSFIRTCLECGKNKPNSDFTVIKSKRSFAGYVRDEVCNECKREELPEPLVSEVLIRRLVKALESMSEPPVTREQAQRLFDILEDIVWTKKVTIQQEAKTSESEMRGLDEVFWGGENE